MAKSEKAVMDQASVLEAVKRSGTGKVKVADFAQPWSESGSAAGPRDETCYH